MHGATFRRLQLVDRPDNPYPNLHPRQIAPFLHCVPPLGRMGRRIGSVFIDQDLRGAIDIDVVHPLHYRNDDR